MAISGKAVSLYFEEKLQEMFPDQNFPDSPDPESSDEKEREDVDTEDSEEDFIQPRRNFTSLCPNGSQWVWEGLGECAQDGRDMASVCLGLLSIVCFMVSSLP
ncbi:hypothetical protein XENOCAPTIV_015321 [Xenoophorus captivus]|uniref:Uncharacterized protein n=1 Tax=Xenoophorus captivus TaxID=1517983 RepID=A0ABV0SHY2_9TELE